jgi:hypothetical protein
MRMRRLAGMLAGMLVAIQVVAAAQVPAASSLYKRLGMRPIRTARIRQLVVDQLCAATGGACVYIGRSSSRTGV